MRYHAHALAANGVDVDLVGLEGTPLPREITDEPRITVHRIATPRLKIRGDLTGSTYAVAGLFDAIRISVRLWRTLRRLPGPNLVIVQNPPAFPTLAVTWFSLHRRGVRFVIDWHNLGYTLLQLRLGQWHPAVRLARWFERRDARRVDANLCVSRGLAAFLESRFAVKQATVLYDRPASAFTPIDRGERERFRQALFTRLGIRANTVGFVVCPTSWTEDEDFDVVIEAVMRLEERIRGWEAGNSSRRFPELVILVTGDGARRAEFERRFAGLPARRIQLRAHPHFTLGRTGEIQFTAIPTLIVELPDHHLGQHAHFILRAWAVMTKIFQAAWAKIIRTSLQHSKTKIKIQRLTEIRKIALDELILQVDRVRGDDHPRVVL
jgi:beta-1,4-mannosyltransferase